MCDFTKISTLNKLYFHLQQFLNLSRLSESKQTTHSEKNSQLKIIFLHVSKIFKHNRRKKNE